MAYGDMTATFIKFGDGSMRISEAAKKSGFKNVRTAYNIASDLRRRGIHLKFKKTPYPSNRKKRSINCAICGNNFIGGNRKLYCSAICKNQARRDRQYIVGSFRGATCLVCDGEIKYGSKRRLYCSDRCEEHSKNTFRSLRTKMRRPENRARERAKLLEAQAAFRALVEVGIIDDLPTGLCSTERTKHFRAALSIINQLGEMK